MVNTRRLSFLVACALPAASGAGCATDSEPLRVDEAAVAQPPPNPADAPDAGPPLEIVDVTATGAGCPRGSWELDRAPSGEVTVRFTRFALSLAGDAPTVRTAACNVSFQIRTAKGASYALRSVAFTGDASLDPEVRASLFADVAFTGFGVGVANSGRLDLLQSGSFDFAHEVDQLAWAPCDTTSNLQLRTRLNVEAKGAGKGEVRVATLGALRLQIGPCPGASPMSGSASDAAAPLPPAGSLDAGLP